MRRVRIFAVGIVAVSVGVFAFAGSRSDGRSGIYGAYTCTSCQLGSPAPDAATLAYIRSMDQHLQGTSGYTQVSGDVFIICNSSACVNYTRSDDMENYFGGLRNPVQGGGGSGGDGPPSGGGAPGGGGGGSGGGGVVIVGPIDTEVQ